MENKPNTRQSFMDVVKAMSIFCMPFVHIFNSPVSIVEDEWPNFYFVFNSFITKILGATTFMFCMGMGLAYSSRFTPQGMLSRFYDMFKKAWFLNIVRGVIPFGILYLIIREPRLVNHNIPFAFSLIETLHFAAMAFLLLALLCKLKISANGILILSIGMALIASFIKDFDLGNHGLNLIVGFFMGTEGEHFYTSSPLFHWFLFVAAGYRFALFYKECKQPNRMFAWIIPISLIVFTAFTLYFLPEQKGLFKNEDAFYHMDFISMLYCISGIFLELSIFWFISKILPNAILHICENISRNINDIYIIHWILIGWGPAIVYIAFGKTFSLLLGAIYAIIIFMLSFYLADKYAKYQKKKG